MLTEITTISVSVLELQNGANWRRAYSNSEEGRAQLQADFPDAYEELCGEGKPWGVEPTVFPEPEPEYDGQPEPEPTIWDEIAAAYREGVNEA